VNLSDLNVVYEMSKEVLDKSQQQILLQIMVTRSMKDMIRHEWSNLTSNKKTESQVIEEVLYNVFHPDMNESYWKEDIVKEIKVKIFYLLSFLF